jgi:ADP-heptose:LPS heptosyltransferase
LGDVLLAIPALRALGAGAAHRQVVLAAQPRIGRLLAALGGVDRHVAFDTLGVETLFADNAPSERLAGLASNARVVSWFGHADREYARRLRALAPEAIVASTAAPEGTTVWKHLLATVGSAPLDAWREPMAVPPAMVAEGRRVLADGGWDGFRPLVVLHPGAGGAHKRWPAEGFAALATALADAHRAALVVHDGPADHEAVAALRGHLGTPAIHLLDPSLDTLAGVTHHAALWLGNDSGVTHLAAALGAPTVALFIAAHMAWRPWWPGARVRTVAVDALSRADLDAVTREAGALLGLHGAGNGR